MKLWILFLSFILVLGCTVFGQEPGPSKALGRNVVFSGRVSDINGAVILSGQVVARSIEGKDYRATTDEEGLYLLSLPQGIYKVEANANGFCPKRVEEFRVSRSIPKLGPLNFVLELPPSETPGVLGYQPCNQKTMIKKEPQIRKPEIFRSIAE